MNQAVEISTKLNLLPEGRLTYAAASSLDSTSGESEDTNSAALLPATQPVDQQFWKLYPPVMPSTFKSSPQQKNPRHRRLSIFFMLTSFSATPPAVTNSSLNTPFPVTSTSNSAIHRANFRTCFLGASDHLKSLFIPLSDTIADQSRLGIMDDPSGPRRGQDDDTIFFGDALVMDQREDSISSVDPNSGAQWTVTWQ